MSNSSRFQNRILLGHLLKKRPDQHLSLTCVLSGSGRNAGYIHLCTFMEPILYGARPRHCLVFLGKGPL